MPLRGGPHHDDKISLQATVVGARDLRIAVLGIGLMGFPMARRLCEAGHTVRAWNRTGAKAERLLPFGAVVEDQPAAAVADAEIVILMLENGDVVEQVLFGQGVARAVIPGTVLIDMSSIMPAQARDHGARLNDMAISYLDAPVSGGTVGAEQGTLAIMAGGKASSFERARKVLEVLGRPTLVGPSGSGQLCKIANQMIVGISIGAVAEAILLVEKGGASPAKFREAITGGFADSRILQLHGQRMADRSFTPGGRVSVQLKDLRNALATAQDIGLDAPVTQLLERLYADAADHGLADLDHAALFLELAKRNGMG
jgi:2-hydroxy-3-oxopropionate reductase